MAYSTKKPKGYGKNDWVVRVANEEIHFKTKAERDKFAKSGHILWNLSPDSVSL